MPRSAGVALISADTWPLSPLQGVSFLVAGRSPPSRSTFPWTLPEPLRILGSFLVVDSQITPSCSKSRTCAYRVLCTPLAAAAHRSARSSRLQTASTRSAIAWVRPRCIPGVGPSSECERSSLQLARPSGRVLLRRPAPLLLLGTFSAFPLETRGLRFVFRTTGLPSCRAWLGRSVAALRHFQAVIKWTACFHSPTSLGLRTGCYVVLWSCTFRKGRDCSELEPTERPGLAPHSGTTGLAPLSPK